MFHIVNIEKGTTIGRATLEPLIIILNNGIKNSPKSSKIPNTQSLYKRSKTLENTQKLSRTLKSELFKALPNSPKLSKQLQSEHLEALPTLYVSFTCIGVDSPDIVVKPTISLK